MPRQNARILIVDDPHGGLTRNLRPLLSRHRVEVARDAVDVIYQLDCADRPYDLIFCDLARGDVPGPELWAYLSLSRGEAAKRMVFVASGPLAPSAAAFLARVPNARLALPASAHELVALTDRRRTSAWPMRLIGAPLSGGRAESQ
jgi:DNA-binding NtrC family response regulator